MSPGSAEKNLQRSPRRPGQT